MVLVMVLDLVLSSPRPLWRAADRSLRRHAGDVPPNNQVADDGRAPGRALRRATARTTEASTWKRHQEVRLWGSSSTALELLRRRQPLGRALVGAANINGVVRPCQYCTSLPTVCSMAWARALRAAWYRSLTRLASPRL